MADYQDRIARGLVVNNFTVYGGYVYKKLVNGDKTNGIDVLTKDTQESTNASNFLQSNYKCKQFDKYIGKINLVCPYGREKVYVNIYNGWPKSENRIFKLQYKLVDSIPTIVNSDSNEKECAETIKHIEKREYWSWDAMRSKDLKYFQKWTDLNSFPYNMKKYFWHFN